MPIHDISLEIQEDMITWNGDEILKPEIEEGERSEPSGSLSSRLCLDSHTGTHVDAPKHFLSEGYPIDQIPLDKLMGKCKVVDCTDREREVKAEDIEDLDEDILIFKTRNSELLSKKEFDEDYVYPNEDACKKIVNLGYESVGIDYLGIGNYENTRRTHELLLSNEVIVIEGLDLRDISPGEYRFVGLPLKISGCDGSPIRAVLEDPD